MIGRKMLAVLALGVCVMFVAGCQDSVTKTDYDALKKHDQALQDENAGMRADVQRLADQQKALADAQARAAAATPAPATTTNSTMANIAAQLPEGTKLVTRDGKPVIRIDGALVNFGSGKASL